MIGLMGGLLIDASGRPELRPFTLTVAGLSKATFITLVLPHGSPFLSGQAGVTVESV